MDFKKFGRDRNEPNHNNNNNDNGGSYQNRNSSGRDYRPENSNSYRQESRDEVFSKKIKAGKRVYYIDVKETRNKDYYIVITESKKRLDDDSFDKNKIFLYKEDFNKFAEGLLEALNHVKNDLLPDFDYDRFSSNQNEEDLG